MNREEIKNILPHREPMLLLDEAELNEAGESVGKYTVKGDEFFLQGHFPGNPIVPGVIQCEMIAQAAVLLISDAKDATPMYTGLNNVKFKNPLLPGDTAVMTVSLTAHKGIFYFAKGKLEANGKLCTSAEFSFALVPKNLQIAPPRRPRRGFGVCGVRHFRPRRAICLTCAAKFTIIVGESRIFRPVCGAFFVSAGHGSRYTFLCFISRGRAAPFPKKLFPTTIWRSFWIRRTSGFLPVRVSAAAMCSPTSGWTIWQSSPPGARSKTRTRRARTSI